MFDFPELSDFLLPLPTAVHLEDCGAALDVLIYSFENMRLRFS